MSAQQLLDSLVADALARSQADGCTACGQTTLCGDHFTPEIEDAGWNAVAERMGQERPAGSPELWSDAESDIVMIVHGPTKPPYGSPEREAYDRQEATR